MEQLLVPRLLLICQETSRRSCVTATDALRTDALPSTHLAICAILPPFSLRSIPPAHAHTLISSTLLLLGFVLKGGSVIFSLKAHCWTPHLLLLPRLVSFNFSVNHCSLVGVLQVFQGLADGNKRRLGLGMGALVGMHQQGYPQVPGHIIVTSLPRQHPERMWHNYKTDRFFISAGVASCFTPRMS